MMVWSDTKEPESVHDKLRLLINILYVKAQLCQRCLKKCYKILPNKTNPSHYMPLKMPEYESL